MLDSNRQVNIWIHSKGKGIYWQPDTSELFVQFQPERLKSPAVMYALGRFFSTSWPSVSRNLAEDE